MTTYELIRRLLQMDPDGDAQIALSVTTMVNNKEYEAAGFIDETWVERPQEGGKPIIVLTAVDD